MDKRSLFLVGITALLTIAIIGIAVFYSSNKESFDIRKGASRAWPNEYSNWLYRNKIDVSGIPESQSYPVTVMVEIPKDQIDNRAIKEDLSDIRFANGNVEVPYFAEEIADRIIAYVRLSEAPIDNSLYFYYGNPESTDNSKPELVFDYFKDYTKFNPSVKFSLITDVHYDSNTDIEWRTPDGSMAYMDKTGLDRVKKFTELANSKHSDFVIELGDPITSQNGGSGLESKEEATTGIRDFENMYKQFRGPRYYVNSNHEVYSMSLEELMNLYGGQGAVGDTPGVRKPNYYFDKGGVRFIILDINYDYTQPDSSSEFGYKNNANIGTTFAEGFVPYMEDNQPKGELAWLDSAIRSTDKPVVIFSGTKLDDLDYLTPEECNRNNAKFSEYCKDAQIPNVNLDNVEYMCQDLYKYRTVKNFRDVQTILEKYSDRIIATIGGHDHINTTSIVNGIQYRTIEAADNKLTDSEPLPNNIFVEIDPSRKLISVNAYGTSFNDYKQTFDGNSLKVENNIDDYTLSLFNSATTDLTYNGNGNFIVGAKTKLSDTTEINIGYTDGTDFKAISHRCTKWWDESNPGHGQRPRFVNAIGAELLSQNDQVKIRQFEMEDSKLVNDQNKDIEINGNGNDKFALLNYIIQGKQIQSTFAIENTGNKISLPTTNLTTTFQNISPAIWVGSKKKANIEYFFATKTTPITYTIEPAEIRDDDGSGDQENTPPNAQDDLKTAQEGTKTLRIDVLANDSDPDGDRLTISSTESDDNVENIENQNDVLVVTLKEAINSESHDITFKYEVSDGHATDSANVTIEPVITRPPSTGRKLEIKALGAPAPRDDESSSPILEIKRKSTSGEYEYISGVAPLVINNSLGDNPTDPFKTYTIYVPMDTKPDELSIEFTNDYYNPNPAEGEHKDRNVAVKSIKLDGYPEILTTSDLVETKGSVGIDAQTGERVACGTGYVKSIWLFCNGYFRVHNIAPDGNPEPPNSKISVVVKAQSLQTNTNKLAKLELLSDSEVLGSKVIDSTNSLGEYTFAIDPNKDHLSVRFANDYWKINSENNLVEDLNVRIYSIKVNTKTYILGTDNNLRANGIWLSSVEKEKVNFDQFGIQSPCNVTFDIFNNLTKNGVIKNSLSCDGNVYIPDDWK